MDLEEAKEYLKDKCKLLNVNHQFCTENAIEIILQELEVMENKLKKVRDEIVGDRMEQFDDYVIYLLTKYVDILEE